MLVRRFRIASIILLLRFAVEHEAEESIADSQWPDLGDVCMKERVSAFHGHDNLAIAVLPKVLLQAGNEFALQHGLRDSRHGFVFAASNRHPLAQERAVLLVTRHPSRHFALRRRANTQR